MEKIKVISLFDGMSCGRIALEQLAVEVEEYHAFEVDPYVIKISEHNYPDIIHHGDVFKGDFTQFKDFDLLIGGSPCTYWSIARGKGRETTSSGLGFEFFKQYVRCLEEAKPKYFLYENNFSIAQEIKDEITKALGVEPIVINSGLVSAQNRKRCYWTNIPNITQPKDKGIKLFDVLKEDREYFDIQNWAYSYWGKTRKLDKLKTIHAEKAGTLTTRRQHPQNYYLNPDRTKMTLLTAEEAEQLQTVPIGYTNCVAMGHRFKALGNGWTIDVITHILSHIFEYK